MINSDKSLGMVPEDLLLAGALSEGIQRIRDNPYYLDFIFNWFSKDSVSKKYYGDAEKKAATDWFLNNKIFVSSSNLREDAIVFPMVTIGLQQMSEDIATLGDVNYETSDLVAWEQLLKEDQLKVAGPFSGAYNSTTGAVTGTSTAAIFPGQRLYAKLTNTFYTVLDVIDDLTFTIEAGLSGLNLSTCFIVGADLRANVALESVEFKQQYTIRCFTQNEPKHLMYLSCIIRFILLAFKQDLLEGRGFQRSVVTQQGAYEANSIFSAPEGEFIFGQNISITGYVREYWPKEVSGHVLGGFTTGVKYQGGRLTPANTLDEAEAQGWWQENDPLPSES